MSWSISLLICAILFNPVYSNVIGIDFGSSFISFGLLKAGHPITVVRNEIEKRLTPSLVTLDGYERFIGARAVSKVWSLFVVSFLDSFLIYTTLTVI